MTITHDALTSLHRTHPYPPRKSFLFGQVPTSNLEVFTNSPQYKNANIANFVLAVPLEINKNNEFHNIQM